MKFTQQLICSSCQHVESLIEREFGNYFQGTVSHGFRVQTCGKCGHNQMNLETIIRGDKKEETDQLDFPPTDDPTPPAKSSTKKG